MAISGQWEPVYPSMIESRNRCRRCGYLSCTCPSCSNNGSEEIYRLRKEMNYMFRDVMVAVNRRYVGQFLPEPEKPMSKLTTLAKRILDKDTKSFVKAGILDKDLSITSEGRDFLLAHYLQTHKKALAVEARKKIAEKKEEEEDVEE